MNNYEIITILNSMEYHQSFIYSFICELNHDRESFSYNLSSDDNRYPIAYGMIEHLISKEIVSEIDSKRLELSASESPKTKLNDKLFNSIKENLGINNLTVMRYLLKNNIDEFNSLWDILNNYKFDLVLDDDILDKFLKDYYYTLGEVLTYNNEFDKILFNNLMELEVICYSDLQQLYQSKFLNNIPKKCAMEFLNELLNRYDDTSYEFYEFVSKYYDPEYKHILKDNCTNIPAFYSNGEYDYILSNIKPKDQRVWGLVEIVKMMIIYDENYIQSFKPHLTKFVEILNVVKNKSSDNEAIDLVEGIVIKLSPNFFNSSKMYNKYVVNSQMFKKIKFIVENDKITIVGK